MKMACAVRKKRETQTTKVEYTLENEREKIFAKSNSIVDLRKKAYNIAVADAMKHKEKEYGTYDVYHSSTFYVLKNGYTQGVINCMVIENKNKYLIDRFGKKEIVMRYDTLRKGNFYLKKDGTIKRNKE